MTDPVIQVKNLGKRYVLGQARHGGRYRTLRESLVEIPRASWQRLRGGLTGAPTSEEEFWALRDVSFEVRRGEVMGVIGRNGAGKSTLLKVLSRITEPTEGRVTLRGRVASLLEVGTGFHPELTGYENIYLNGAILGMSRSEIKAKFDDIVAFAEVERFLDTPVKRYSSGMYVRLAFAVAAHLDPEILIVDEVLAVGDAEFQKKCLGKMQSVARTDGRTVLFVSHNMAAVRQLCDTCIHLNLGKLTMQGPTPEVIDRYFLSGTVNTTATIDNKALRSASISQQGKEIVIEATYALSEPTRLPMFGFVLKNQRGEPIFGCNPVIEGLPPAYEQPQRDGRVTVRITSPRLYDGLYHVSVWFVDHYPDLLTIEVTGMVSRRQPDTAIDGCVIPECDWTFA